MHLDMLHSPCHRAQNSFGFAMMRKSLTFVYIFICVVVVVPMETCKIRAKKNTFRLIHCF